MKQRRMDNRIENLAVAQYESVTSAMTHPIPSAVKHARIEDGNLDDRIEPSTNIIKVSNRQGGKKSVAGLQ